MNLKDIVLEVVGKIQTIDYRKIFGSLSNHILSVERKGDMLFIYVTDPMAKYVLVRKKQELLKDFEGVKEIKIVLKK